MTSFERSLYRLGITYAEWEVMQDDRMRAIKDSVCILLERFGDSNQWEEPTRPEIQEPTVEAWMLLGRTRSRDNMQAVTP